ncbi:FecR family protein [Pseudomonas proteolytica]|uniref:FecR domain-containing protein n=1 Tax=Pseudomonas proteolytica TaxID=219574 RepID=UPI0023DF1058|nr:FecR family protein [Pseudomonas proteolytica]MDF3160678.1 FecR family protein [Pseudomonas proteolytica]
MSGVAPPALPKEIVDQAIEWFIRLTYNQPEEDTRLAFNDWLARGEEHLQAWERIQSLGGRFAGMPVGMAMQAIERLPEARLQRRQMLKFLTLFAAAGGTSWTVYETTPWQRLVADFSTRVGERRRWHLEDGSLLDLNTDSAVRLRFDAASRELELLRGELHVISGSDSKTPSRRPLTVSTALGTFEALGTRFSVRLNNQTCSLSVMEGHVGIRPQVGNPTIAQAGQIWRLTISGVEQEPGNAADVAAWRDGLLVARDMPLAQVLRELGRYRNGHLGCAPEIAGRRINGNFNLADTDATLLFLAQAQGLRLHALTRYWVRLSA